MTDVSTDPILIALGANLPAAGLTPRKTLDHAVDMLGADPEIKVAARSRWYRSPAFPPGSGPDFVNGAARLESALAPAALLARLHAVEAALGRVRPARWAPRACDIDLLAMGDTVLPDREAQARWMGLAPEAAGAEAPEGLVLPHPRLQERAFVLLPLAEIAADWVHPVSGRSVAQMRDDLPREARDGTRPL